MVGHIVAGGATPGKRWQYVDDGAWSERHVCRCAATGADLVHEVGAAHEDLRQAAVGTVACADGVEERGQIRDGGEGLLGDAGCRLGRRPVAHVQVLGHRGRSEVSVEVAQPPMRATSSIEADDSACAKPGSIHSSVRSVTARRCAPARADSTIVRACSTGK